MAQPARLGDLVAGALVVLIAVPMRPLMRSPLRSVARRIALLGLLVGAAAAMAAPAAVTEAEARPVRAVIQAQLDAFAADDAERAFAQAAPALRQQFGQAERFVAMVKQHYPVVWRPAAVRFLKAVRVDGELTQGVLFTDAKGLSWLAAYRMERQADGSWRIAGCEMVASEGRMT